MEKTYFPLDRMRAERTPFYYYDVKLLDNTLETVRRTADYPGFHVHYAVKANANPEILKRIAASGLGADTVSLGEIKAAIDAGFPAPKIVFAGVGKTDEEIAVALEYGIGCFNAESEPEIEAIEAIAKEAGKKAPVALRVNPEIDAHTHHYITTGLAENKFGIPLPMLERLIERCLKSEWIEFKGLHFHIGSQVTDLTPFKILCERINELQDKYKGIEFASINVGGGLGIDYDDPDKNPIPDFRSYFSIFHENLKLRPGQQVHFELGRAIVAQCGSLISRVTYVKEGIGKKFLILDAGMTALIRPALYQAHHKIENLTSTSSEEVVYDVVGPICESSDTFGTDELLPLSKRGDLIAMRSAGAYGEVMASSYNCRVLPGSLFSR
ncbi:MAG: diaminopimelate decarboxylase [Muribaculaceae bacterium]|nr:diaminopimelate decarboxylase [Muribaculaceae bacterium]